MRTVPQPTADPARTRAELTALRPDLIPRYDAALPGARAAVLARLYGALEREPLPGLSHRKHGNGRTEVTFRHGETVTYPTAAAEPFAQAEPPGDPVELVQRLWPGTPLRDEIANSVANLALARAVATPADLPEPGDPAALGKIEQMLVDGHPLHPCCRTRTGMTVADVLAYAPEHRPLIRLRRLRVPADRWHGTAQPILYAHPWQATRLLARYPWLTNAGVTRPVRPLMSLRTVAPISGGPHIKTAVDIQMTSAVRTVSPAAVHNGPRLSALLTRLTADLPLDVLTETEAGAVITEHGPDRHLAHLIRQAPRLGPGETAIPLGVLATTPILRKTVTDPYAFMSSLGTVLFAPLARVLQRGIALEAHGQNTLIVLAGGHPVRTLYRDLGGIRVHTAHHPDLDLHGDLPTDDPAELRTKLAAAALGTVALQLVTALAHHHDAEPARLWTIIAAALRATGTPDIPHLLTDPLPIKATTAMRLAADPLTDQWTHLPNPMAA
ncbi:IucA/IucC family protein [Actinoplanes aureus]|uniref:IucA/IucC family siderophore biosynthesis protein n=1 Tax=Actinoplanes aureus TaxID=2792083 RepID=A0A931CG98_9ACTN|nr:IucA/IucC family siderophore biosynthesis protein [Actinoplanes aureus]MBG0565961.1 IucA/IucC family siderophore biosynthesis protein [Actinoplanes aureus]